MEIIKTRVYERDVKKLAISAQNERRLFEELAENPERGALIAGSGGLRKIRIATGNKGKSGGARIIYYFFTANEKLYLLTAYAKSAKSNLTSADLKLLKQIKSEIERMNTNG